MTWQQVLIGYLLLGVITFIALVVAHHLDKSQAEEKSLQKALDEIRRNQNEISNRDKPKWKRRVEYVLEEIVAPVLATLFVVVAWPIAFWWKVREMWTSKMTEPAKKKEFAVEEPEHLLARQDLDELEAKERVSDPLGAVPELPFGHLNSAWVRFKAKCETGDAIWSFSARWSTNWGRDELRRGYVIVRADGIGAYFLTARRMLEGD